MYREHHASAHCPNPNPTRAILFPASHHATCISPYATAPLLSKKRHRVGSIVPCRSKSVITNQTPLNHGLLPRADA